MPGNLSPEFTTEIQASPVLPCPEGIAPEQWESILTQVNEVMSEPILVECELPKAEFKDGKWETTLLERRFIADTRMSPDTQGFGRKLNQQIPTGFRMMPPELFQEMVKGGQWKDEGQQLVSMDASSRMTARILSSNSSRPTWSDQVTTATEVPCSSLDYPGLRDVGTAWVFEL